MCAGGAWLSAFAPWDSTQRVLRFPKLPAKAVISCHISMELLSGTETHVAGVCRSWPPPKCSPWCPLWAGCSEPTPAGAPWLAPVTLPSWGCKIVLSPPTLKHGPQHFPSHVSLPRSCRILLCSYLFCPFTNPRDIADTCLACKKIYCYFFFLEFF